MKKVLTDEESTDYFVHTLFEWVEQKKEKIENENMLHIFEQFTKLELLSLNVNLSLMRYTFSKALNAWLDEGGDLNEKIISNLGFESYRLVIDKLLNTLKKVFASPKSFVEFAETHLSGGGNEDIDEEDNSTFLMSYDEENNFLN